jgi:hypothetical protein
MTTIVRRHPLREDARGTLSPRFFSSLHASLKKHCAKLTLGLRRIARLTFSLRNDWREIIDSHPNASSEWSPEKRLQRGQGGYSGWKFLRDLYGEADPPHRFFTKVLRTMAA